MRIAVVFAAALFSGCAAIPVQDTTLRNSDGSSGRGRALPGGQDDQRQLHR